MKKGYRRLLVFCLIMFLILILNSFVWSILSRQLMVAFLGICLFAFKFLFGLERDRHRYIKDLIMEILIFLLLFFIMYYIFGIIIGFARTGNYRNLYGIINFIIPIMFTVILREILRYMMMCKAEGNRLLYIVICLIFIFVDITISIAYGNFGTKYKIFLFIALTLLPSISSNIVYTYLTLKTGYKPIIFYALIMELYQYLLPIVPNPSEYLVSVIRFILPIILFYIINKFFKREHDDDVEREYHKKRISDLIIPSIVVMILVYFTSGYFHYQAIAIASGSMMPVIDKGDVVIIEKIDSDYSKLEVGQVIAYRYEGIVVVHRLVNIIKDRGVYYFYSKGDANPSEDNYVINEDQIIGVVNNKIPYVGLPTVWLNNL